MRKTVWVLVPQTPVPAHLSTLLPSPGTGRRIPAGRGQEFALVGGHMTFRVLCPHSTSSRHTECVCTCPDMNTDRHEYRQMPDMDPLSGGGGQMMFFREWGLSLAWDGSREVGSLGRV